MAFVFRVTILRHKDKLKYFSFLLFSRAVVRRASLFVYLYGFIARMLCGLWYAVHGAHARTLS